MHGKNLRGFLSLILISCGLPFGSISAQQSAPDVGFVAPRPTGTPVATSTSSTEKRPPMDINGIVAQAFKRKSPIQLINPMAPAKYGNGRENVSWDPDKPEKPKGIILFGIQW